MLVFVIASLLVFVMTSLVEGQPSPQSARQQFLQAEFQLGQCIQQKAQLGWQLEAAEKKLQEIEEAKTEEPMPPDDKEK
jgi:chaperonin cofactor prefoldin